MVIEKNAQGYLGEDFHKEEQPIPKDQFFGEGSYDKLSNPELVNLLERLQIPEKGESLPSNLFDEVVKLIGQHVEQQANDSLKGTYFSDENEELNPAYRWDALRDTRSYLLHKYDHLLLSPSRNTASFAKTSTDRVVESLTRSLKTSESVAIVTAFMESSMGNNLQMIRPDVLYAFATELFWLQSEEVNAEEFFYLNAARGKFLEEIQYLSDFAEDVLISGLRQSLAECISADNPVQALKTLELFSRFLPSFGQRNSYQDVSELLLGMLEEFKQETDNFLLDSRLEQLVKDVRRRSPAEYRMSKREFEEAFDDNLPPGLTSKTDGRDKLLWTFGDDYVCAPLALGHIGIYTGLGALVGYVLRQELADPTLELKIYPLSNLNTLVPNNERTQEHELERKKEDTYLLSLGFREVIGEEFDINFADLSIHDQTYFLSYLKYASKNEVAELIPLAKRYDRYFFTAFISLESGGQSMGNRIIQLCKDKPDHIVEAVLAKYYELCRAAFIANEYTTNQAGITLHQQALGGIQENLLQAGKRVLIQAADAVISDQDLINELDQYKADLLLFGNVFKQVASSLDSLEQFKELSLHHAQGGGLEGNDRDQMLVMTDRNWDQLRETMSGMYAQIMHDVPAQLDGKDPKTGDPLDTEWHLLKRNNSVLGFFRLDVTNEDTRYFGSMNSSPDLHGFKIGDAVLKEMLQAETKNMRVEAHASPKTAICRSYINKYGFVATGLLPYYETGEILFAIEQEKRPGKESTYELQGMRSVDLARYLNAEQLPTVKAYTFDSAHPNEEYEQLLTDAESFFSEGAVLSAYMETSRDGSQATYYVGFEKPTHINASPVATVTQTVDGALS